MFLSIFCVGDSRKATITLRNKLWKNPQRHFSLYTWGICTNPQQKKSLLMLQRASFPCSHPNCRKQKSHGF